MVSLLYASTFYCFSDAMACLSVNWYMYVNVLTPAYTNMMEYCDSPCHSNILHVSLLFKSAELTSTLLYFPAPRVVLSDLSTFYNMDSIRYIEADFVPAKRGIINYNTIILLFTLETCWDTMQWSLQFTCCGIVTICLKTTSSVDDKILHRRLWRDSRRLWNT